jgi:hypothetical protein
LYRVSAEIWRRALVGGEEREKRLLKRTIRPAVFTFGGGESIQLGIQIQLDWRALMV